MECTLGIYWMNGSRINVYVLLLNPNQSICNMKDILMCSTCGSFETMCNKMEILQWIVFQNKDVHCTVRVLKSCKTQSTGLLHANLWCIVQGA